MKIRYVLDTHALIWSVLSPDRLGVQAYRAISSAAPGELAITSATIIELGRLIDTDRIELNSRRASDVFGDALAYNKVLPTSLEAATKAPTLDLPHADPFDRLIVAEALVLDVPLITKDGNITDSDTVHVVWWERRTFATLTFMIDCVASSRAIGADETITDFATTGVLFASRHLVNLHESDPRRNSRVHTAAFATRPVNIA